MKGLVKIAKELSLFEIGTGEGNTNANERDMRQGREERV